MSAQPKLRTKSGMANDVDPIRLLLATLALLPAIHVATRLHHDWWIILLAVSVAGSFLLGWWVTRSHYLDNITVGEYRLKTLADSPNPKTVENLRENEGPLALQAGWNLAANEVVGAIQKLRPDIPIEAAAAMCEALGRRLPR